MAAWSKVSPTGEFPPTLSGLTKSEAEKIFQNLHCCEVAHPWDKHCMRSIIMFWLTAFPKTFKFYAPIFLVPALVQRKSLHHIMTRTLLDIARSTSFISFYASGFHFWYCVITHLTKRQWTWLGGTCGFLTSVLSILVEKKARRPEVALYCLNQAAEAGFRMLQDRGLVKFYPQGDVLIFVISSALLGGFHRLDHASLGGTGKTIMKFLTGGGDDKKNEENATEDETLEVKLTKTSRASLKVFLYGLGFRAIISLVRGVASGAILKKPLYVVQSLISKPNLSFAAFLGGYSATFRILEVLLDRVVTNAPDDVIEEKRKTQLKRFIPIVCGAAAGCCVYFSRSAEIGMYLAGKVVEAAFHSCVKRGWIKSYYYGDVLVFGLANFITMQASFYEPHNLRPSYWNWLVNVSDGKFSKVNREAMWWMGRNSTRWLSYKK